MSAVVDRIKADALAGAQQSRQRYIVRARAEAEGACERAGGQGHDAVKAYDEAFIYNYLFCRELPADDVIREAMAAGIHPSDVGKAHDALGIKTVVDGGCKVLWKLPDEVYRRLCAEARAEWHAALTSASPPPNKKKPAKRFPKSDGRLPKEIRNV